LKGDVYRAVEHDLLVYPCGLKAGDRLRLARVLEICDHRGRPTGVAHRPGEIWVVTAGARHEPEVIWLQQPDGEPHTWDASVLFDHFERF
jgi:hypothetical protein